MGRYRIVKTSYVFSKYDNYEFPDLIFINECNTLAELGYEPIGGVSVVPETEDFAGRLIQAFYYPKSVSEYCNVSLRWSESRKESTMKLFCQVTGASQSWVDKLEDGDLVSVIKGIPFPAAAEVLRKMFDGVGEELIFSDCEDYIAPPND